MNGAEHYAEAEALVAKAHDMRDQSEDESLVKATRARLRDRSDFILERAQVHATLSLAAAMAAPRHLSAQESWGGQTLEVDTERLGGGYQ